MSDRMLATAPRRHDRLSIARGLAIIVISIMIASVELMLLPSV